MIKIAIVDDHQLFREGLAFMLAQSEGIEVKASFGDGGELLSYLKENSEEIEVLLLDISMPEVSGLNVLKTIRKLYPRLKSIILSMHNDGNYIVQSVQNGALGYLLKNVDKEELTKAIETVYVGKKYFNKEITELLLNNMSSDGEEIKKLSAREVEILNLIATGLTTKEIAEKLIVSTRTIETHRVNMMKKLNVKNSAELIKKATERNLF